MSSTKMMEMSKNSDNLRDEIKSTKINAFQFMMDSRHKVIGSNSPGKDRKDVEIKSPEMKEKSKEKLIKRKATFENWAEKKGGTKRKLADEAAEKHINKTLYKRAKRLKKMLAIIDEELKNSGEECSDAEEIIKVKINKRRVPLIDDSENSSNADEEEHNEEDSEKETKSAEALKVIEESVEKKKHDKPENKIEFSKDETENSGNDTEETEENSSKINDESNTEDKENTEVLNKETKPDSTKKRKNQRNINKKKNKRSLSLNKSKNLDEPSTASKEKDEKNVEKFSEKNVEKNVEKISEKKAEDLTDEEIFPEAIELPKPAKTPNSRTRQLKLVNDSNLNSKKIEDKKKCFTPRSWRMKVKLAETNDENANEKNEKKDSDDTESDEKESSKDTLVEDDKSDDTTEDSSQKTVTTSQTSSTESSQKIVKTSQTSSSESLTSSENEVKTPVKLAPIFLSRNNKVDKQAKKEALNAKKNFLQSGVPSKVKKLMTKTKSFQEPEYVLSIFPKISHVQQKDDDAFNSLWNLPNATLRFKETESSNVSVFNQIQIGNFTNCTSLDIHINTQNQHAPPIKYKNLKEIVKEIKEEHPAFPVYKMFRLLYQKYEKHTKIFTKPETQPELLQIEIETPTKRKRGRPKKKVSPKKIIKALPIPIVKEENISRIEMQMWTEKYRPQSQEEIIGNTKPVQELKSWLESWIKYSEDRNLSRKRRLSNSSDDFCSDSTSRDTEQLPQNLILLFGPLGSGKTSSVYGLCNELSINVIEINASSKRAGKKILADLQEATQSHQVKNTDSKSVNSFFQKKPDSQSEEDINKKMSLLLFEDVDIVFEDQDDNFISALSTLIISSKRPIILTSTDSKCPHLQKFVLQYTTIYFTPLTNKILSPWLQILCLIEGVKTDKNMLDRLVETNKGDVRKTILQLQFWAQTGGDPPKKLEENCAKIAKNRCSTDEICVDDESPELSWINTEETETDNKNNICHKNCAESFTPFFERDKEGFKLLYPVNLDVLWWNVPEILGQKTNNFLGKQVKNNNNKMEINEANANKSSFEELNAAVNFLESLAITDVIHTTLKTECYHRSVYNYWETTPANSLSLNQDLKMHCDAKNTSLEISHWLVENTAKQCETLRESKNIDVNRVPYFSELSWRSNHHKNMKELLNAIPIMSILDRKAICEDYQTILRTINRTEKERSTENIKRKNRFYHYFRNFNIHLNDSTYSMLCNTLAKNNVE